MKQPFVSEMSRRRKLSRLKAHFPAGCSILEVGSGTGVLTEELRSLGYKVTSLDIEREADIQGDINDWKALGLTPSSFDGIVGFEVIEHVDCLESLRALCKPDGLIMLSSPHPRWDWVMQLLEKLGLNQQRTSPHDNLTDFASIPLPAVVRSRPLWIHQVAVFKNVK